MYWEVFSHWKKEYGPFKWASSELGWAWETWAGVIKLGHASAHDFVTSLDRQDIIYRWARDALEHFKGL